MAIKAFTLILEEDGSCKVFKGEGETSPVPKLLKEHFNHYGNACVSIQKECEKFVAEQRMERSIKTKKEIDDAQGDT